MKKTKLVISSVYLKEVLERLEPDNTVTIDTVMNIDGVDGRYVRVPIRITHDGRSDTFMIEFNSTCRKCAC